MSDPYESKRRRVAAKIKKWKTGTVTLTRGSGGSSDAYELDAVVKGVISDYVDGKLVLATDLMAIVSPKALHTHHGGVELEEQETVDIVPYITDVIHIDGVKKVIKKIPANRAAGLAARFDVVLAS